MGILRGGHVVGVEDHQFHACGRGGFLGPVIDLIEEESLLVDRHQRIGVRMGGGRGQHRQGSHGL